MHEDEIYISNYINPISIEAFLPRIYGPNIWIAINLTPRDLRIIRNGKLLY